MLVLASASPRRGMLLAQNGLSYVRVEADVNEDIPEGTDPQEAVKLLALRKAQAGLTNWLSTGGSPQDVVLGADTIVVLDGQILGKPESDEDALQMLRALSGRTHEVYTGVALLNGEGKHESEAICTKVTFRSLTTEEILDYIQTGEPQDKAGSYGIQGHGGKFVAHYEGSFSNVIGLPMEYIMERLSVWGIEA